MSIISRFKSQYGHLEKSGLAITGLVELDNEHNLKVIDISHPFIFDHRRLPKKFEGVDIRSSVHGELPQEFQIDHSNKGEYLWAPERFEKFVDRSLEELRIAFNKTELTREEALDALCFGDFEAHKLKINRLIKEGSLPPYVDNQDF